MSRRREKPQQNQEEDVKMSKEMEDIAKYVRFNCPTKQSKIEENEVHYFQGSKAVDTLWESKYAQKAKKDPKFKTRDECFHYLSDLFSRQLFFRAQILKKRTTENRERGDESAADAPRSPRQVTDRRKNKKAKEEESVTEAEGEDKKKEDDEKKGDVEKKDEEEKPDEKDEKKKKKVKLLVHKAQVFTDDKEVFVWVFDPTPLYKKIIGILMLLGTIVGCLFPLWPIWLRQGVYYLSMGGIGVFASIIIVAILRTILFGIIYAATFGKHKLWILPNLTEDCGVLESFQPFYTYEYVDPANTNQAITNQAATNRTETTQADTDNAGEGSDKKDKKKKKEKAKESDEEEEEKQLLAENDEDDEDAEKFSQDSSDDNYEKIGSEISDDENLSSVPPSPAEGAVRKRRPNKV